MERLTFEGNFCDIAQCDVIPGGSSCESGSCTQRKVWERLKAYEDTGLEPESVEALKLSMMGKAIAEIKEFSGLPVDLLRELAEADKDGRLVVLPVKPVLTPIISSMLYIIEDGDIYEDALYEAVVGMSESGKTNVVYTTLSDQMIFEQADIGKTVFLTREAAGKALEAMKKGETEHA